ncbi:hypothetical protein ACFFX1_23150 [Dactylosporangium sucinum]|uniref:Uncharacterized protein n=1 Tax=Dactylosporangium sucinum TaxID=1424081 RepID=A0A917U0P3_9ACTN|nr:hypothetical protein [Dactylosporangium sucinum]GGM49098.1 hypothetical protein GCM10007977_058400 [Dactylosporangium sucinum]
MDVDYTDEEWGLLVGLPQSVLIAASQAEADGSRRTREEWTVGMTAIADGRGSASSLVQSVAAEVVARQGNVEEGEEPPIIEFPDRDAGITDVISRAGQAHELLVAKADPEDAEAYRFWLITVTDAVVSATRTGGVLGLGGEQVTPAERSFRDSLATALAV